MTTYQQLLDRLGQAVRDSEPLIRRAWDDPEYVAARKRTADAVLAVIEHLRSEREEARA